ncbi:hypothetical protein AB6A40_008555 [Gnathostoma spinigerum]|uniref:Uncharacterized protein n=1 Tax=Gnathostoma spinigerum TaxID=75299 RepID=A0ABD6EPT9_9BILA
MGVGDLYGLFACMVTSRSWKSVTEGVAKTTSNDNEREEIKAYAACLIPQISEALERMPRPMILILKTNDLLRSIEYRLGTQNRSDAFLQMARCCIRSMCQFTLKNTDSVFRILIIYFEMYFELAKLFIYENYLMLAHWNYVASS